MDERAAASIDTDVVIVDVDVHPSTPLLKELLPFLSPHWRDVIGQAQRGFDDPPLAYPVGAPTSARSGSPAPGDGAKLALELLHKHIFEAWGTRYAILNCIYQGAQLQNPDASAALAASVNDWLVAHWLDRDARLRGSIVVAPGQPDLAAAEIERVAAHPGFVQVLLPARSAVPYGNRRYLPIFEAAARHDLAIGIHFGGTVPVSPTGTGWPSHYIEEYTGMAQVLQTQLLSIIAEGVLDRFPLGRITVLEGGFAWLPAFLWRFEKDWKAMRRETPWNRRSPSEYVRDHVKFSTQPMDGPKTALAFGRLLDQLGGEQFLMFSTDYPHQHYNSAGEALPPGLQDVALRNVVGATALGFYRLETP